MTGYDDTTYLRQAIRCKVIDYLLKPINKTELYDALANLSVELLDQANKSQTQLPAVPEGDELGLEQAQLSKNVRKIIHYIDEHYAKDVSLDQISEHVYLHPNYISSLFKKETGLTFIQYLHLYRIRKAKELMLRDPELSFQRISEQVGYENVRHFFNVFKKFSGGTPGITGTSSDFIIGVPYLRQDVTHCRSRACHRVAAFYRFLSIAAIAVSVACSLYTK